MKHPDKWRETADPFTLPFKEFAIKEVLGYPHAGNDVFHVRGTYLHSDVEAYIKIARQKGADIKREIDTISKLQWSALPEIIDHDVQKETFMVSLAKDGERLSTIVGDNEGLNSSEYLYEYGQALALLHRVEGNFDNVEDRPFFHIPTVDYFQQHDLQFVYDYLVKQKPKKINRCFCHGDFHYANILWKDKHISAILDFELSGIGNKEFDIAWAIILRPGQRFLKTREEITVFLEGYRSKGSCEIELVKYYMVLIYSHFFAFGTDTPGYRDYVLSVFRTITSENTF